MLRYFSIVEPRQNTHRYGRFDVDMVILVLSSRDAADAPTFEPGVGVNPGFRGRKPMWSHMPPIILGISHKTRGRVTCGVQPVRLGWLVGIT